MVAKTFGMLVVEAASQFQRIHLHSAMLAVLIFGIRTFTCCGKCIIFGKHALPLNIHKTLRNAALSDSKLSTCVEKYFSKSFSKSYCGNFHEEIGNWDVSEVTDMSSMFAKREDFNEGISNWEVSKVTAMNSMFKQAKSFNADIGNWDVSKVEDMSEMFQQAQAFNQDISDWHVSRVAKFSDMFKQAERFNQDISSWQVSESADISDMFHDATAFNRELCGVWADVIPQKVFVNSDESICTLSEVRRFLTANQTNLNTPLSSTVVIAVVTSAVLAVLVIIAAAVSILIWRLKNRKRAVPRSFETPETPMSDPASPHPEIEISTGKSPSASAEYLLSERSYANSNYRQYYGDSKSPKFQYALLSAVHLVLTLYLRRTNTRLVRLFRNLKIQILS